MKDFDSKRCDWIEWFIQEEDSVGGLKLTMTYVTIYNLKKFYERGNLCILFYLILLWIC
jgi:hypothetical protein